MSSTSSATKTTKDVLTSLTDEELIKCFQNGEQKAFVLLMRRYKEPITNFVYRFLGNYDEAVDLAQETFVRLFRFADKYSETAKFSTWLFTIAANLAKSELRKKKRQDTIVMSSIGNNGDGNEEWDIPDRSYTADARVDTSIISQRVQIALMSVSPTYREAVVMRDLMQLSYEEICQITDCEMGTVKSRINRGRKQLQDELKDLYNEMFT